jgi:hypothetical protein
VANRNCQVCLKYLFDEDTGRIEIGRDGQPEERFFACPPPCQTDRGCPKGTPENPKTLSDANEMCYQHYRECRAIGCFPDEAVVRRNAALVRDIEDKFAAYEQQKQQADLIHLLVRK